MPRKDVQGVRTAAGYTRTAEDLERIRTQPDQEPPPYTGQLPLPAAVHTFARADFLIGLFLALAVFTVYFTTLPPTVTGEDSGELVVAAYELGIPHPPGYPLWCLLAHPFTLLPFGTVAWRVALSSAVFASGAVYVLYLLGLRLSTSRLGGIAAALAFAFSSEFWEQSVIAEVYALNALLIVVCLLLLLLWYEKRQSGLLYAFALIYGLSLGNHSTMRLLGPAFLLFVLVVDPIPWRRWKTYALCILISLVGLSVNLYLPLRSAADPYLDWGNPETWGNLWAVLKQEQFAFLRSEHPRSLGLLLGQVGVFFQNYWHAMTPLAALLPVLGFLPLWRRSRFLFGALIGLGVTLSLVLILVLNFGTDKEARWLNHVFFIPFYMVAALFLGLGLVWFAGIQVRGRLLSPIAWLGAIAIPLALISIHYRANDKSDYWFAYDYGRNILEQLDPNAIYIPGADHATFPAIYLQAVEGVRPDVTIGNKYGYIEKDLYEDMPFPTKDSFRRIPTPSEDQRIKQWIIEHTDRPVYFTDKDVRGMSANYQVVQDALVFRVVRPDEILETPDRWDEYSWHSIEPASTRREYTAELILSDYYFMRGLEDLANDEQEAGLAAFETSVRVIGETKEALNNVGSACAEHELLDEAADYFARAIFRDRRYVTPVRNLAKVYLRQDRFEDAYYALERVRQIGESDYETYWLSAQCLRQMDRPQEALERLTSLLQQNPGDADVYREVGMIYLQDLDKPESAEMYLRQSLQLDPDQPELRSLFRGELPGVTPFPQNPTSNFPGSGMPALGTIPGIH